ncbi:MAG: EamA family transporter [Fimbriimonadaceae bacterium]
MRTRLIAAAAFFSVYFFWGSTYLATERAVREIPPMLMLAFRFLLAGILLYVGCRVARIPSPTPRQWLYGGVQGFLLVFGGNAGVTWAVQHLPTGTAALLIATEPVWLVLMLWLLGHGHRPSLRTGIGLLVGVGGIVALSGDVVRGPQGAVQLVAAAMVLLTAISWSLGSALGVCMDTPRSPFMASAVAMLTGGLVCGAIGWALGEPARLDLAAIGWQSIGAVAYLAITASILGLSAYLWLLLRYPAPVVATYAFVNPLVALGLGAALNAEPITPVTLVASALIILSVILLNEPRPRPAAEGQPDAPRHRRKTLFARAS